MEWEEALRIMGIDRTKAISEEYRWSHRPSQKQVYDRLQAQKAAAAAPAARLGAKEPVAAANANAFDRGAEAGKAARTGRTVHSVGAGFDANGRLVRA